MNNLVCSSLGSPSYIRKNYTTKRFTENNVGYCVSCKLEVDSYVYKLFNNPGVCADFQVPDEYGKSLEFMAYIHLPDQMLQFDGKYDTELTVSSETYHIKSLSFYKSVKPSDKLNHDCYDKCLWHHKVLLGPLPTESTDMTTLFKYVSSTRNVTIIQNCERFCQHAS